MVQLLQASMVVLEEVVAILVRLVELETLHLHHRPKEITAVREYWLLAGILMLAAVVGEHLRLGQMLLYQMVEMVAQEQHQALQVHL
jgi:hypothetical protein